MTEGDYQPYWILDRSGPTPVERAVDLEEWSAWFERSFNQGFQSTRLVKQTAVGGFTVSTVFLSLNHAFVPGTAPVLYETMICEGCPTQSRWLDRQWRWHTWAEAVAGHEAVVETVKAEQTGRVSRVVL